MTTMQINYLKAMNDYTYNMANLAEVARHNEQTEKISEWEYWNRRRKDYYDTLAKFRELGIKRGELDVKKGELDVKNEQLKESIRHNEVSEGIERGKNLINAFVMRENARHNQVTERQTDTRLQQDWDLGIKSLDTQSSIAGADRELRWNIATLQSETSKDVARISAGASRYGAELAYNSSIFGSQMNYDWHIADINQTAYDNKMRRIYDWDLRVHQDNTTKQTAGLRGLFGMFGNIGSWFN